MKKADFILTPECSSFSLNKKTLSISKLMKEDVFIKEIKLIAKKYKKWILIGSVILKRIEINLLIEVLINNKGSIVSF